MFQGQFTVKRNDEVVASPMSFLTVIDIVEKLIYEHGPGGLNVTRYNGIDYDDITDSVISICE